MKTRRSPKNQEALFKNLFKHGLDRTLLAQCKEARKRLAEAHTKAQPDCRSGCPSLAYVAALDSAISQAEAPKPRWNADLNGQLRAALANAQMEIEQISNLNLKRR